MPRSKQVVAHDVKTEAEPGTRLIYANWGYNVLGYLVSRLAGAPWDDAVADTVLNPLGMIATTAARVLIRPSTSAEQATGHVVSQVDGSPASDSGRRCGRTFRVRRRARWSRTSRTSRGSWSRTSNGGAGLARRHRRRHAPGARAARRRGRRHGPRVPRRSPRRATRSSVTAATAPGAPRSSAATRRARRRGAADQRRRGAQAARSKIARAALDSVLRRHPRHDGQRPRGDAAGDGCATARPTGPCRAEVTDNGGALARAVATNPIAYVEGVERAPRRRQGGGAPRAACSTVASSTSNGTVRAAGSAAAVSVRVRRRRHAGGGHADDGRCARNRRRTLGRNDLDTPVGTIPLGLTVNEHGRHGRRRSHGHGCRRQPRGGSAAGWIHARLELDIAGFGEITLFVQLGLQRGRLRGQLYARNPSGEIRMAAVLEPNS